MHSKRDIIAERSDGFQCHVAGTLDGLFIVLLQQQSTNQPGDCGLVGDDADNVAAAFDLAVEAFDGVGGVYLGAVLGWEAHVGQHISLGTVHRVGQRWHPRPGLIGDVAPLLAGGRGVVLGERGADAGRHDTALRLACLSQGVVRMHAFA